MRLAVKHLPETWTRLVAAIPSLESLNSRNHLEQLQIWLDGAHFGYEHEATPAMLSAPLTVMLQFWEYWGLRRANDHQSETIPWLNGRQNNFQGFCFGLLLAIVYSITQNQAEEFDLIKRVINLAMVIGTVIDYQRVRESTRWACLRVYWENAYGEQICYATVDEYAEVRTFYGPDFTNPN